MNLEKTAKMMDEVKKNGLKEEFRKHIAYMNRLRRKGIVSDKEFLNFYDSTLITLSGMVA